MRKLILLVALCALLVIALVWFGNSGRVAPVESEKRIDAASTPAPTHESELAVQAIDAPPQTEREMVAAAPKPVASVQPVDTCIVFGLVVDGNDQPLAGVVARLCAWKVWAEGLDVPRLSSKYDHHGWEMTTGDDGRLRFEGPTPTVEQIWITLEPRANAPKSLSFRPNIRV